MPTKKPVRSLVILMVEDNPTDVLIAKEGLRAAGMPNALHVTEDGIAALDFLHQRGRHAGAPRPDLILLDLNLPGRSGQEVLAEIKADENLKDIPVVILTASQSEEDVRKAYSGHANCYITKPADLEAFTEVVQTIQAFWFSVVTLPPDPSRGLEKPSPERAGKESPKDPLAALQHDQTTMNTDSTLAARPIIILMAEDNPTDVLIAKEGLLSAKMLNTLHVASDGVAAMEFLRRAGKYADSPRPDLILLDLNMPRKNGQEVLAEIKADDDLKNIPVVILTTSQSEEDVSKAYEHHANCYITKPVDFDAFTKVVQTIQAFWFCVVTLPPGSK